MYKYTYIRDISSPHAHAHAHTHTHTHTHAHTLSNKTQFGPEYQNNFIYCRHTSSGSKAAQVPDPHQCKLFKGTNCLAPAPIPLFSRSLSFSLSLSILQCDAAEPSSPSHHRQHSQTALSLFKLTFQFSGPRSAYARVLQPKGALQIGLPFT